MRFHGSKASLGHRNLHDPGQSDAAAQPFCDAPYSAVKIPAKIARKVTFSLKSGALSYAFFT
jgi:hypothetical protein